MLFGVFREQVGADEETGAGSVGCPDQSVSCAGIPILPAPLRPRTPGGHGASQRPEEGDEVGPFFLAQPESERMTRDRPWTPVPRRQPGG